MLVVSIDTWPSHARIVLMSTPDAQEVRRGRVADDVGTDRFLGDRPLLDGRVGRAPAHGRMDCKSGEWSPTPIQEDRLTGGATGDERAKDLIVFGQSGQCRVLPPLPPSGRIRSHRPRTSRSPMVTAAASLARAPVL